MDEFSNRQRILLASFDLTKEEEHIFGQYYRFLDDSGVAEIINTLLIRFQYCLYFCFNSQYYL